MGLLSSGRSTSLSLCSKSRIGWVNCLKIKIFISFVHMGCAVYRVAEYLQENGFDRVINVDGGMAASPCSAVSNMIKMKKPSASATQSQFVYFNLHLRKMASCGSVSLAYHFDLPLTKSPGRTAFVLSNNSIV